VWDLASSTIPRADSRAVTEEGEVGMSDTKIFIAVMAVFAVVTAYALTRPSIRGQPASSSRSCHV
jgi:hypothetical protein